MTYRLLFNRHTSYRLLASSDAWGQNPSAHDRQWSSSEKRMFTTDSRTEKFLDVIGAKWQYVNDVSYSMLASNWAQENLGRSQARVEKAVEEYRTLMDRGSAAPAPIIWKNPSGEYVVLDGAQRIAAAESRNPTIFSAYVVQTDSEAMAKRIRVFANYRLQGGYQESAEWTLERAITLLVATGQMSVEECADFGGWSISQVRDKAQVVDFRLSIQGVGGPERLPDSIVRLVAKHAAKEDFAAAPVAIAKFTNAVQRMRLSADEADPYIEQFFAVARSKPKLFEQFQDKWAAFSDEDGVQARLADPTRTRYQPMTAEGRVLKSLRASLTTTQRVLDAGESICDMAEYFHVVNQIRTALQQIDQLSRKK